MNHAFASSASDAANTRPSSLRHASSSASPARVLRARMEHRWGERFPVRAAVRLHCAKWDAAGYLKDASLSGAFVHTRLLVAPWTQVELELLGIRIVAYVVRVAPDGLGIEWTEFAPRVIRELLSL
jgi:PilZ domain